MGCCICLDEIEPHLQIKNSPLILSCGYHDAHISCAHHWFYKQKPEFDQCFVLKCCVCQRNYDQEQTIKLDTISLTIKNEIINSLNSKTFGDLLPVLRSERNLPINYGDWMNCANAVFTSDNPNRGFLVSILKEVSREHITFFDLKCFLQDFRSQPKKLIFWVTSGEFQYNFLSAKNGLFTALSICLDKGFWQDLMLLYVLFFKKLSKCDKVNFGKLILKNNLTRPTAVLEKEDFLPETPRFRRKGYGYHYFIMIQFKCWAGFILRKIILPTAVELNLFKDLEYFATSTINVTNPYRHAINELLKVKKFDVLEKLLRSKLAKKIHWRYYPQIKRNIKKSCENPHEIFKIFHQSYRYSDHLFRFFFK